MEKSKLLRCPFCGGEADVDIGNFGGMVCYCKNVSRKANNVKLKKKL